MIKRIKILGLQRSGTNWIEFLIRRNLDVYVYSSPLVPFFKHALPDESIINRYKSGELVITEVPSQYVHDNPDELFIIIRKPLDKWIASIRRNPADLHQKRPEIFSAAGVDIKKAGELYTGYHSGWMALNAPNVLFTDYVGVLKDYSSFLELLVLKYNIRPLANHWKNVYKVPHSGKFTSKQRKRYLS